MNDLISRQAAIDEIKALYEWHDTVTEDRTIDHLKRLPTAQLKSANELAEKVQNAPNDDFISREAAIDALNHMDYMPGEWAVKGLTMCKEIIKGLPSAQPETHDKRTKTHACDLISRQAAIEAFDNLEWFHQNANKDMVSGANPEHHQAWYKEQDVYKTLEQLPSVQPEIKPISYEDCANAMLEMWMDNVLTDGEYNRIMDKLNKFEAERRTNEVQRL